MSFADRHRVTRTRDGATGWVTGLFPLGEPTGGRWIGHLDAYLARHGATRESLRPH